MAARASSSSSLPAGASSTLGGGGGGGAAASSLLVVLGVFDGRNFPRRSKHQLVVEALFDSELLATDPTPHVELPNFAQELAWELDRKSLQQHRLQRSSVKVKVYAVDPDQSAKEQVGYVILPVRSAGTRPAPQYHTLLSSKYSKTKPEIKISVYVDESNAVALASAIDSQTSAVERTAETSAGVTDVSYKDTTASSLTPTEVKALTPQLDEEQGWYLIGEKMDPQNRTFMLCITVAFAANLKHLLPSGVPFKCATSAADSSGGFFFFYTLFGNAVTTDPFFDVLEPNFPSERASVRIRSTLDKLGSFLSLQQPGVELHLCYGAQSLGKATLPIQTLLAVNPSQVFMQPVSIEETYRLLPKSNFGSSLADGIPQDAFPMVGVAMTLKLDEPLPDPQESAAAELVGGGTGGLDDGDGGRNEGSGGDLAATAGASAPTRLLAPSPSEVPVITIEDSVDDGAGGDDGDECVKGEQSKAAKDQVGRRVDLMGGGDATSGMSKKADALPRDAPTDGPAQIPLPRKDAAPDLAATARLPSSGSALLPPGIGQSDFTPLPVPSLPNVVPHPHPATSSSLPAPSSVAVPPASHHLCCTIELRSFKDLGSSLTKDRLVFLRYLYPFFGFNEPIHTFPASRVVPHSETMLPNSYCAFDFASPLPQLNQTFMNHPLMVELWGRSEASGHPNTPQMVDPRTDALLGIAKLPLLQLLQTTPTSVSVPTPSTGGVEHQRIERRMFGAQVPVVTIPTDGASSTLDARPIGEIDTVICLADYGLFESRRLNDATEAAASAKATPPPASDAAPSPPPPPIETPRESLEYKAALELELWKEKRIEAFEETLKQKEASHLQAISEEYKRRERERELMMKKRIGEYSELETQLRSTLAELEARQKAVVEKEKEVDRIGGQLRMDHEDKVNQARNEARRMVEDAEHKVTLEKKNARSLEEQITKLKHELNVAETKSSEREKEFEAYKLIQKNQPEVKLQQEVHILTLEKHELEKKVEAATKSKLHYKQQWGKTLKELARFKQREAEGARERLKAQEHELEHLRLRYLVNEEREVAKSDNRQIDALRAEIAALRLGADKPDLDRVPQPGPSGGGDGDHVAAKHDGGRVSPLNLEGVGDEENDFNRNNRVSAESHRHRSGGLGSAAPSSRRSTTRGGGAAAAAEVEDAQIDEQIARLIEERDTLLQTGVYSGGDRIILELDRQIKDKMQRKKGGVSTFHHSPAGSR